MMVVISNTSRMLSAVVTTGTRGVDERAADR
jgi:hypothetical protein